MLCIQIVEQRDGYGKLRNDHGKVMDKYCVKSARIFLENIFKYQNDHRDKFRGAILTQ